MEKVFLYEYATCGFLGETPPSMAVEGLGMFKALLEGFEACCRVTTFIDPSFPLFPRYPRKKYRDATFAAHLVEADNALLIAPESRFKLYNLTRALEKSDCANLGSSSRAVHAATDKYETYKKIKHLSPRTEIFNGRTGLSLPLVAKPRDGVSGEGIFLVEGEEDLKRVPRGYLLQELVQGRAMSASLLIGGEVRLLSINTQESEDFHYQGAKLPLEGIEAGIIQEAVSRIKGLQGYVGVDFVLGEELKIIEINPRPTTPIIALGEALGVNVSELIVKNYYREVIPELKPSKRVWMMKLPGRHPNSYISHRGYSIVMRYLDEDIDFRYRRGEH